MTRHAGLIIIILLALVGVSLRWWTYERTDRLLAGEARALETFMALHEASQAIVDAGRPHPGLAALLDAGPDLELLETESSVGHSYARDDVYMYGLATRDIVNEDVRTYGYILRAWPREFGSTGDQEYHIQQDGRLWLGANERGRSGIERGFPPMFPDPLLGKRKVAWWLAEPDQP